MSDIHANAVAFEAVLIDMKSIMPDMIIFLGDLLFNGPSPKETYDLLKDVQPTVWIRGNTDDWLNEIVTGWEPSLEIEKYCYTRSRDILHREERFLLLKKHDYIPIFQPV